MDGSLAAQIMAIDKSFGDLTEMAPEDMRHPDPKKRSLRVVEVGTAIRTLAHIRHTTFYRMQMPGVTLTT